MAYTVQVAWEVWDKYSSYWWSEVRANPMPSSTCPAGPGPSNPTQSSKRIMSDAESINQDSKKARINSSAEPSSRHDSNRDAKRRRRRKRKAPVVSQPAKNEATQSRPDERSRAPLSARNEIIRFTSVPLEPDLSADMITPSGLFSKTDQDFSLPLHHTTDHASRDMSSTLNHKFGGSHGPSSTSLEEKIARLEAELCLKDNLIASHQALLNQVQQAITCQICLDLMYKPYALAPCGHLACYACLVNWFTAPSPDNRPIPPPLSRKKTCPHCRAVVSVRPIEVWGVKGIVQTTVKSGLLQNQLPSPAEASESRDANPDPWKDIFRKTDVAIHPPFPWFFPDADVDDDDVHITEIAARGEDVGMLDMEDGGIYRCLDCMHEIWDGICTSCGRVYPGHRPERDEDADEGGPIGWLEDQRGAEEVDVADDPGWIGLEDGEADDGGYIDWPPFGPWRAFHGMPRGAWGYLGAIHVDEEDEDEDEDSMYGRIDDLRVADEDGESAEEGYESSFIDDGDERGVDRPRIYEIRDDDEDEGYYPHVSDDDDGGYSDVPQRRRRYGPRVVSSDDELADTSSHKFVESDGSDGY